MYASAVFPNIQSAMGVPFQPSSQLDLPQPSFGALLGFIPSASRPSIRHHSRTTVYRFDCAYLDVLLNGRRVALVRKSLFN